MRHQSEQQRAKAAIGLTLQLLHTGLVPLTVTFPVSVVCDRDVLRTFIDGKDFHLRIPLAFLRRTVICTVASLMMATDRICEVIN